MCVLIRVKIESEWCVAESKIVFNAVHSTPTVSAATETLALAENVRNALAMLFSFSFARANRCQHVNRRPNVFFGKVGFAPNFVLKGIV